MKKVLFFIESLSGGGAEKVLTTLVKNIDKSKFDVTVLTVVNTGTYLNEVKKYCKVKYILDDFSNLNTPFSKILYRVKYKYVYTQSPKTIYNQFVKGDYDVEIAFIEGFATKIISASTNEKSKKIAWVHTDMKKNPYAQNCYKNSTEHMDSYKKLDKICCVSESVKEVFCQMFFDDDRVIVQYNPVDRDDIIKKGNEEIDLIPNSFLQLGTIGRLEEQKGFTRLIDCVGKLKEQDYKFSLWIVGEGSLRGELETKIKEYSLEDYVKLVGFHSNPYKYMSKCDAFICSSYAEGFSTSATEALILGKPIFTTDCAGMNELFGGEKCGEIVPNTDEGLYDMLENLASGKWQPQDYTQAVQNRIDFFDIKERIKEIEGILDN